MVSSPKKSKQVASSQRVAGKTAKPRKAVTKSPLDQSAMSMKKEQPASRERTKKSDRPQTSNNSPSVVTGPVKLLSGGNPQISKGEGDAPVQAYIAAMPGWKSDIGRRLDSIIERAVPGVHKAVKWNSPLYGITGQGWFLGIHCFSKYIKLAFFRGASLHPIPPGKSKQKEVRYLDIYQDDQLDEIQLADWIKQASQLPGEKM